ncbi:MAG TPA: hypothetical protein DEP48_06875 [Persephonella sp.]|uniref:Ancillary SecYEG translocon subunit/Cell division coordinator CpoB TPR domain-containing protein n=1 Tax=Persephonella marina (strain DSM 14350 / EX-H1) TaxID=123214 RepID=C0QUE8_PERMH|nr:MULTISPECIES: tetratricopeptide repeat protein [Persephonella]ACO03395.1 hypothetical protein PERMA_0524 [Persephonella marina EX-H1]HCB70068.1 hypothetical protein [Persephonella sp.]
MKKRKVSLTPEQKKDIPVKEVPIKEDVDLEFEYKIYMLFDKLKKYKLFIIAGFVAFILLIIGFVYLKSEREKLLNEASGVVYDIRASYIDKKYDKADNLIKKFKERYSDTPYLKLVLAYELLIQKEKNNVSEDKIKEVEKHINSEQIRSGLKEFYAYTLHSKGKNKEALTVLDQIDQKYYNYISALLLKGFILKKEGKNPEDIFRQITELSKYNYFKKIAEENL